jgi:hypothetical protein
MQDSASFIPGKEMNPEGQWVPWEPWNPSDRDSNPFRSRSDKDNDSKNERQSTGRSNKKALASNCLQIPEGGPPSDSSSSDSDSLDNDHKDPPKRSKPPEPPAQPKPSITSNPIREPQFDLKLKPELVPQWDGNINTLARWISKVNRISEALTAVHRELGAIIPRRLTGTTETWYYSIPDRMRRKVETNWDMLKKAISDYWMNHAWLKSQKICANQARYHEPNFSKELPSEYLIRKLDLISLEYDYTDSKTIWLVMAKAPDVWQSILNVQFYSTITEFQNTVKFHKDTLIQLTPRGSFLLTSLVQVLSLATLGNEQSVS